MAQLREDYGNLKSNAVGALGFLGIKKGGSQGSSSSSSSPAGTNSSSSSSSSTPSGSSSPSSGAGAVATNLVYAGLKFSGLAARVAGDLASSLKADAEKMMKDMEVEAEAKVGVWQALRGAGGGCVRMMDCT